MNTLAIDIPIVSTEIIENAYIENDTEKKYDNLSDSDCISKIKELLLSKNAVLIAHYYAPDDIQELAENTGGCIADSLEMARFGSKHPAQTLVIAGVRFMGETAKILNPEKRILMSTLKAECSLDLNCPADLFKKVRMDHSDYTAVVYANTSAAVKAESDWVVTSSNALQIVSYLKNEGRKILWASDKYLGNYIQTQTEANMLLWPGACIVHERFKASALLKLKNTLSDVKVLVHPESPPDVIELADYVGSTTMLLNAAKNSDAQNFIVATEPGIFYKMRMALPHKNFIKAPKMGEGATCESCTRCPWMEMNVARNILYSLENNANEIHLDKEIIKKALLPIQRMMNFSFND